MLNGSTNNYMVRFTVGTGAVLGIAVFGAIDGVITSYAIDYIADLLPFVSHLPSVVIGGIIGVGLIKLLFGMSLLVKDLVSDSKEFPKKLAKMVVLASTAFGVGVKLVDNGVTSPAVIGALAALALILLKYLIDPPSSLINIDKKHQVESAIVNDIAMAR